MFRHKNYDINPEPNKIYFSVNKLFSVFCTFLDLLQKNTNSRGMIRSFSPTSRSYYTQLFVSDRICYLAAVSGTCGLLPIPGFNTVVDIALIRKTVNFYKTQLGLPEENSYEFSKLTTKTQKKIREFCVTSAVQIGNVVGTYGVKSAIASEVTHLIPLIGSLVAGSISFSSTYFFLNCCLNDMEEAAIEFLDILNEKVSNDIEQ